MNSNNATHNERIFVTGPGGAGKSTYAKRIAEQKSLPYYELDHIRWPDRTKLPDEIFRKKLRKIVSDDSWIIDGTLKSTQDIIFPRCTKIIVLTASRATCMYRALSRTIKRLLKLEDSFVFNDFEHLFSKDFIVIRVWRHYPRYMRQLEEALNDTPHSAEVEKKRI